MGRAHGGVGRGDDRHSMGHISSIELKKQIIEGLHLADQPTHSRIPNGMLHVRRSSLDLLQHHRLRPAPTSLKQFSP